MRQRLHALGPLVEYRQDRPGWVSIRLTFDEPWTHVMPHVHAFEHEMIVESGRLRLRAGDEARELGVGDRFVVPAGVPHGAEPQVGGTIARCDHEIRCANGELLPEAFSPDGVPLEWLPRIVSIG
jgi:hypothetical protein